MSSLDAKTESTVVSDMLASCDAFLFDCDGTIYHASQIVPGTAETLQFLRDHGKRIYFVTNTSSRSCEQLQRKLIGLGIDARLEECYPSGAFASAHIRAAHPQAQKVYVIGGTGLQEELRKVGIESDGENDAKVFASTEFAGLTESVREAKYDGVVVGWDLGFSFRKITTASLVFETGDDASTFFYATNDDAADRLNGHLIPGTGVALASVERVCEVVAPERKDQAQPFSCTAQVLGKPNPDFARYIADTHGLDLSRTCMVGDRLVTDILMAQQAGMKSLFVLTGVNGEADIATTGVHPSYTLSSIGRIAAVATSLNTPKTIHASNL